MREKPLFSGLSETEESGSQMKERYRPKIAILTYEYGNKINGGVGRVVNSLASNGRDRMDISVIHLVKPFFTKMHFLDIRLMTRSGNQKKFRFLSPMCAFLIGTLWEKALRGPFALFMFLRRTRSHHFLQQMEVFLKKTEIDVIHVMHPGWHTVQIVELIHSSFPAIRVAYSLHSIIKHEIRTRHVDAKNLIFEKILLENADHLHLLNASSLSFLESNYGEGIAKDRLSIIPNGIDPCEYQSCSTGFKNRMKSKIGQKKSVACITRWSHGKGLEYLVDAIPKVLAESPDTIFIIAGRKTRSWENSWKKYVAAVMRKIKAMGKNVVVLGWLNDGQRNALLSLSDACIMPSELEYFPYSLLEPMICARPIVTSDIDCAKEMLTDEEDCLFFKSGSSDSMASRIKDLINSPDRMRTIAFNARKNAMTRYAWSRIIDEYAAMYQSLSAKQTDPSGANE
jgi:glycosyltransferase involved in cell wall biosynthesis